MLFEEYNRYKKIDMVKNVLFTSLMIVLFYAYWMAVLLLASVFLVNVWHVSLVQIAIYAAGLTGISSLVYIARLVKKRSKGVY